MELQGHVPKGKQLNVTLFKQLFFKDLDKYNNDKIDISNFTKNYIKSHEELKINLENLKKIYEKGVELLNDLKDKKYL